MEITSLPQPRCSDETRLGNVESKVLHMSVTRLGGENPSIVRLFDFEGIRPAKIPLICRHCSMYFHLKYK